MGIRLIPMSHVASAGCYVTSSRLRKSRLFFRLSATVPGRKSCARCRIMCLFAIFVRILHPVFFHSICYSYSEDVYLIHKSARYLLVSSLFSVFVYVLTLFFIFPFNVVVAPQLYFYTYSTYFPFTSLLFLFVFLLPCSDLILFLSVYFTKY